ncbi:MAG: ABC transporter permease [Lachnospiraceae bacterium]
MKQHLKKAGIILFWLLVWQLVSLLVHNSVMLVGPVETAESLCRLVVTADFWISIWYTFWRIGLGFLCASLLGILLAFAGTKRPILGAFLSPFIAALKSVPVASFVVLLLIWFGSKNLSFFTSLIVVLPILYGSTREGLASTDKKLLEMAQVFRVPFGAKLHYILLPGLAPFWKSAFSLALGMCWKAGVAAEVIGQPLQSIGNRLYQAKIYLETGDLLAWTVVIILLSFGVEKAFARLLRLLPGGGAEEQKEVPEKGETA